MKNLHLKFVMKYRTVQCAVLWALIFVAFTMVGKAQSNSVIGYNYITKIGGQIVSTQTSLKVFPGQEVEYELVIYNTDVTTNTGSEVKIVIPYYANYHSAVTTDGTAGYISGDTILWTLPSLAAQGANPVLPAARLTYTLVSSHDCYALSTTCINEIMVEGNIYNQNILLVNGVFYYDYAPLSGGSHTGIYNTLPVTVSIDAAAFIIDCITAGKQVRQFVYLEDNTVGATIPVTNISDYFPIGSLFYDTIDMSNDVALGSSIQYNSVNGFPKTAGKRSYYALLPGECYHKFYINVLDTTDITFCAGYTLEDAVVWASDWDAISGGVGQWIFDGVPVSLTTPLIFADSGNVL